LNVNNALDIEADEFLKKRRGLHPRESLAF
jgi:hypothetical protein